MQNRKKDINENNLLSLTNFNQELQASNIFYKHVVELTPEAVVIHRNGKIVYANPASARLIGAKNAKQLVGESVMKFIHKDSLPLIKKRIEKMLTKHKVAPFVEEKFITLNGDIIIAETKAIPFVFQGKQAILAILRNVTEQRNTEEKQKFLDNLATLLSVSVDYNTTLKNICKLLVPYLADYIRIVLVNDGNQIEEVVSYHKDPKKLALVKKLYKTYMGQENLTYGVSRVLQSGKSEIIERVTEKYTGNSAKNGEIKNTVSKLGLTSYMGIPLKVNRKVIGVIIISSATKDRIYKKADLQFAEEIARRIAYAVDNATLFNKLQEELKAKNKAEESQAQMASYLDQTFDAILLWKYEGEIVYWNKGAHELYGFTKKEALGKKTHTLLKTKHPIPFPEIEKILQKTGRWEGELIHVTKEGKPLFISCKKVLIIDKDGSKFILETNRDITEHHRIEKNLEFLSESSKILATSLDYKTTLASIAKLAVPHIADWCSVEMKTENGIEQLAIAHVDQKKVNWAKELNKKNPPKLDAKTGVSNVIRTGKSVFYPNITDQMLIESATNKRQLKLLRNLAFSSIMIVPFELIRIPLGQ